MCLVSSNLNQLFSCCLEIYHRKNEQRERCIPLHVLSILMDPLTLTISSDHPFGMPRTYCTATWPWPTLTSISVSEVWQDAVFFLLIWRPGAFCRHAARPLLFLEGLWTAMIEEPIQILSNQATSNQPADQPADESDELNKLSNIRIFEKSTMKERMKERTDQGKKERRHEGRKGRKRMDGGREGGGRKEHMDKWTNVIIHAIMDEQKKKEENQSNYKSTSIPAESTKSQASFKKLIWFTHITTW